MESDIRAEELLLCLAIMPLFMSMYVVHVMWRIGVMEYWIHGE
jgi:hypothetical protein